MNTTRSRRDWREKIIAGILLSAVIGGIAAEAIAGDWPLFRHDPGRTASSDEQLADQLHLQWSRTYPQLIPAWLGEFPHLRFDENYEPIVMGSMLYFGSSDDDSITALDTKTGQLRWRFYANGAVRFAPVGSAGKIYFGADDGMFYCLNAENGKLLWKFDTALSNRKGFIEGRLGTLCPVRGGAVLVDGKVHFVAGMWSFENSAFFTLDVETGELIHKTKGIRSQGYLAAAGPTIYIPNGRAGAVRLTRQTGKWAGGLGGWAGYWDHLIATSGEWMFRMGSLQKLGGSPRGTVCDSGPGRSNTCFYRPVIADGVVYYSAAEPPVSRVDKPGPEIGDLIASSLSEPALIEAKDTQGRPILSRKGKPETKLVLKELWRLPKEQIVAALQQKSPRDGKDALVIVEIKAGRRLYGYRGSTLFAVDLPNEDTPPKVSWHTTLPGTPVRMIAADAKLFVVTREGGLYCFAGEKTTPTVYPKEERKLAEVNDAWRGKARMILDQTSVEEGYALVLGLKSGRLVEELFRNSRLNIVAMDNDPKLVRALREKLNYLEDPFQKEEARSDLDSPGNTQDGTALDMAAPSEINPRRRRIAIYQGDPTAYPFPPFMASLIVSEDPQQLAANPVRVPAMFRTLRPYGGTVCLELTARDEERFGQAVADSRLPGGKLRHYTPFTLLVRPGAPEKSGDWTHEWGDPANTLKSRDHLKGPLGMLWTGGRSARRGMYLDRHVWPPSPIVVDGRMFITGPERLVATDIYTGRVLWEVRSKIFTAMTRGRGGCHTVGASDGLYVGTRRSILRFDPATGKLLSEFALPADATKDDMWGRPRIWNDTLIVSIVRSGRDRTLLALDRRTGKRIWKLDAEISLSSVAIGRGKVFCWEGNRRSLAADQAARRGVATPDSDASWLKALDARDGKPLWRTRTDSVVEWLSYSEDRDLLVASTKKLIHVFRGHDGHELWNKLSEGIGFRGHPGRVWQKVILWHDWMIDQRGPGLAYDLATGRQIQRPHPVTLKPVPWEFIRNGHHCNHAVACENFLTFRSSNATYVDLNTLGTGSFPGVRTGCTNSMIPAGGVLSSPMYSHECVCNYEFFTSMAFANVPDAEAWTYRPNKLDFLEQPGLGSVERLGVNFGAKGERQAPNGTLWFGIGSRDYSYRLSGLASPGGQPFQFPTKKVQGEGLNWVFATGLDGPKTITVPLGAAKNAKERPHTVRLYFIEPAGKQPGERVFSVKIQGQEVLQDFDIAQAAGGPMRGVVKEFRDVKAADQLSVVLTAAKSSAVICGIEVLGADVSSIPPEVHDHVVEAPVGETTTISLSYSDVDGPGPYTFKIVKSVKKGSLSGQGSSLTYEPKAGALGRDRFTWVVHDGRHNSREASVTIKLVAPNVAPQARDLKIEATAGQPIHVALPFRDPDEQPGNYRFELVGRPDGGTVQWQSYNRFVYTPKADFLGSDRFDWKVNDGEADSNVATVAVQVVPDTTGPAVAWIDSAGRNDRIKLVFTEPVAKDEAERTINYRFDEGLKVRRATLGDDLKSVTLVTSPLAEDVAYSLTVHNVQDRAAKPNVTNPKARSAFRYVHTGNGLWAEYYEGPDFQGKKIGQRIDPYIDVDWRKKLPFETMKPDVPYSVRWTGRLKAEYSEEYLLYFFRGWEHNRNPVRVWVDGKLLANESYGPVALEAGQTYDLKVELNIVRPAYYADYYSLRWSSLSVPKQTIPQSNLGTARHGEGG